MTYNKNYRKVAKSATKNKNFTSEIPYYKSSESDTKNYKVKNIDKLDIGADATPGINKIYIDHENAKVIINDGNIDRVIVGYNGGVYGIQVYNESGNEMMNISGSDAKISSSDGKTYFDMNAKRIIVNDGTNDRVLIGFQSGGF